jgi:hypothetical protein
VAARFIPQGRGAERGHYAEGDRLRTRRVLLDLRRENGLQGGSSAASSHRHVDRGENVPSCRAPRVYAARNLVRTISRARPKAGMSFSSLRPNTSKIVSSSERCTLSGAAKES